jgi:hypothetical protein
MLARLLRNEPRVVIDEGEELIMIPTPKGPVYAKKILRVDGDLILYVDQNNVVREALFYSRRQ